jgi:hypothetical protein
MNLTQQAIHLSHYEQNQTWGCLYRTSWIILISSGDRSYE